MRPDERGCDGQSRYVYQNDGPIPQVSVCNRRNASSEKESDFLTLAFMEKTVSLFSNKVKGVKMSHATFAGGNFVAIRRNEPCHACGQPHQGKWSLVTNYHAKPYDTAWTDEQLKEYGGYEMTVNIGRDTRHNYEIVVVGTLHVDGNVSVRGYREYYEHDPKTERRSVENPLYGLLEFIGGKCIVERECEVWVIVKAKMTPLQQPPRRDWQQPESMDLQPDTLLVSSPES